MEERLQKLLAHAGLGSRRTCEEFILAGRVYVNGQVARIGGKADPIKDKITLDGKPIDLSNEPVYIILNKPRGVISTVTSPDPRPTVRDLVDYPGHLYPVGRLDIESEGLILLTNDGELANRLTHPKHGHEKEYRVLVARRPDEEQLEAWRHGVVLEDGYRAAPARVYLEGTSGKGAWLRVIMREGRKRQIRETSAQLGLPVVKIIRVRIGSLELKELKPRQWRHLTSQEVTALVSGQPARSTGSEKRSNVKTESGQPKGRQRVNGQRGARKPYSGRTGSSQRMPEKPTGGRSGGGQRSHGRAGDNRSGNSRSTLTSSGNQRPNSDRSSANKSTSAKNQGKNKI
jgi:23S rRNA pseudouridine2605 synthase